MPELSIDRLAFGGAGVGRNCGKACFVPYAAPGDQLEVSITKSKKSYDEARIVEIRQGSALRTSPPCPFFGECGGCNWQHVTYEEQCHQKEQIVKDSLWRGARVDKDLIRPVIPSNPYYNYRRRIQLKLNFSNGRQCMGFYRPGSHYVVDINDSCILAHESLNSVMPFIRTVVRACKDREKVPQVDLSSSENGDVAAVFHYIGNHIDQFSADLRAATSCAGNLQSVAIQTGRKNSFRILSGKQTMHYSLPTVIGDITLQFAPDGFSQVNFAQNRAVATFISDICTKVKPDRILDLYCGNGNFSLPLASMVKTITGFENFDKSVALANNNAINNGLHNAKYLCLDSTEAVEQFAQQGQQFDLVIIDPPRDGAADVAANIHKTGAASIIYVSCDPMTLARDISILQKTGYKVLQVQPFDMFPQTYHIENVVHLTANQ